MSEKMISSWQFRDLVGQYGMTPEQARAHMANQVGVTWPDLHLKPFQVILGHRLRGKVFVDAHEYSAGDKKLSEWINCSLATCMVKGCEIQITYAEGSRSLRNL